METFSVGTDRRAARNSPAGEIKMISEFQRRYIRGSFRWEQVGRATAVTPYREQLDRLGSHNPPRNTGSGLSIQLHPFMHPGATTIFDTLPTSPACAAAWPVEFPAIRQTTRAVHEATTLIHDLRRSVLGKPHAMPPTPTSAETDNASMCSRVHCGRGGGGSGFRSAGSASSGDGW